jgi:hypothetical protein
VVQTVEIAGVDQYAALLVAVPVAPLLVVISGLAFHGHHLLDGQAVLVGEGEVALVVGGHAHHGAVAIAHQHIVADPHLDLRAGDGVGDEQARGLAFLFLDGQFGLGRAALFAFFDEGCQFGLEAAACSASGCSGATAQKVTPMMVSARVVKTYILPS